MLSLPPSRRDFAIAIILLLGVVATAAPGYYALAQRMDDGALLVYPELILKGWLPYRDFETYYGPGNLYLLAGVYSISHPGIFSARTVGLAYQLAILAAIFCIVRPRGLALAIGSVLIAHLFLLPTGLAPRAWTGALAFALWSVVFAAGHPSSRRIFCAGLFAAVALLYRPDLTPAVFLSACLLLFFQSGRLRQIYLVGLGVGLLPLLVLAFAAGFQNLFDNLFLYPVIITNPARKLPWSFLSPHLATLFWFLLLAVLINLGAAFLALRTDSGSRSNSLFAAAAILALGTTHQTLQRMDSGHLTLCCFLAFALFPAALTILADRLKPAENSTIRQLLLVMLTFLMITFLVPGLIRFARRGIGIGGPSPNDNVAFLQHGRRTFPMNSLEIARESGDLLAKMMDLTSPGQRLFVGPADLRRTNYNDTFLYHLMPQLIPSTYFLEMNPLSANRPGSRLSSDILSADWLILDRRLDEWNEPNESARFGPEAPNLTVQSNFTLVAHEGSYGIYRKK